MQIPTARILQPPNHEDFLPRTVPRSVPRIEPQTVPRTKDRTYNLSTGLHTYGVTYPAGLRCPELIPTGDQAALRHYETISWRERKNGRSLHTFVVKLRWIWRAPVLLYLEEKEGVKGQGLAAQKRVPSFPASPHHLWEDAHKGAPLPWPNHGGLPPSGPPFQHVSIICGGFPPPWGPPPTTSHQKGAAP